MSDGEDPKASAQPGTDQVSGEKGTEEPPKEETAAQMTALNQKLDALLESTQKTIQHSKIIQGNYDRLESQMKKRDEHFEGFLERTVKGQQGQAVDVEAIKKQYRSERESLVREEKLTEFESREEREKEDAEIRKDAEQIAQDIGKRFGVEIPKDKIPDPITKELSPQQFAAEIASIAIELVQAKGKEGAKEEKQEEKPKDTGELASVSATGAAAIRENPHLKNTPSENIRSGVEEIRKRHRVE